MPANNFIQWDSYNKQLTCTNGWTLSNLDKIKKELAQLHIPRTESITVDGKAIAQMDTAGAWALIQYITKLFNNNIHVELNQFPNQYLKLLKLIKTEMFIEKKTKLPRKIKRNPIDQLGMLATDLLKEARDYFAFIGALTFESLRILGRPSHFRLNEVAGTIYKAGVQALPIVALLSFMVGLVIAYESGLELQKYGASILAVDLIGYTVLREFGPLITAILVAGRTGSAFTAQLGIMRINQEIDALNTMSITPAELLLLPRIVALVLTMPLLVIWADIWGVVGGMLPISHQLNIGFSQFLVRFQQELSYSDLLIGLLKAPVFAFIIATMGCFQGMRVERSADNLGRLTTRSVVLSIFYMLVADSVFAIVLNYFKF